MSRHTTRVRDGNDRASLYTDITDKIIAELEAGLIPWVQP
jgi:antirestriction protein ArdC